MVSAGALALADGFIPGAGAPIFGDLSLREVTKTQNSEMRRLGKELETNQRAITKGAPGSYPKAHLPDMILLADLSVDDLIAEKFDAKSATNLMLRKISEAAPRSDYATHAFQSCFRMYVSQMLAHILQNYEFVHRSGHPDPSKATKPESILHGMLDRPE